jgi:hypothetical protein
MSRFFVTLTLMLVLVGPTSGQLTSRVFHADLSADNETRLTQSPASGKAELWLDLTNLELTWEVHFEGLVSRPVSAALHGPAQPGANGLAFVDLAPDGIVSPLRGAAILTEAEVQYLLAGWTYVDITTEKFPYGEARGQVDVGPRPGPSDIIY